MELSKPRHLMKVTKQRDQVQWRYLSPNNFEEFYPKQLEYLHWSFILMVDNFVDRSKHFSIEMHRKKKISTIASIKLEYSASIELEHS